MFVDANWFYEKNNANFTCRNYFLNGQKEKLFAAYLNLYKFARKSSGEDNKVYFLTTVNSLFKTMTTGKRIVTENDVRELLSTLMEFNVINIEECKDINKIYNKEMLKIEDLTYKNCKFYFKFPLDVVEFMLEQGLTYRHVSIFAVIHKYAKSNPEKKAWMSIEKIGEWLGYSNKSVLKYVNEMNDMGVLHSVKKRQSQTGRKGYNHYPVYKVSDIEEFKK